jgi:5,6-dimethylbenzimidazole synthase
MEFTADHYLKLIETLRWRRDVRYFRADPIEPDTLATIEAAVDLAPSVGNSRPWRIIRVNSPAHRQAVIRCFEKAKDEAGQIYENEARRTYDALKLAGLRDAPVHLAFFTDLAPVEGRGLGRQTMPETLLYSTVMAIHTLWLVARTLNVGVGWVSILDPERVSKLLDVPENWKLSGYLCLGYPKENQDLPELHRRRWQSNTQTVWIDR